MTDSEGVGKVINIRCRKTSITKGREESLLLGVGAFLSSMIHAVTVAGLFFILAWSEQGDKDVPVTIPLNSNSSFERPDEIKSPAPCKKICLPMS